MPLPCAKRHLNLPPCAIPYENPGATRHAHGRTQNYAPPVVQGALEPASGLVLDCYGWRLFYTIPVLSFA